MESTITIYGAGYVGLVTAVCLAELGNHVLLVDNQPDKIAKLQQGIVPIFEIGLPELLHRGIANQRLQFTVDLQKGVAHGFFQFITVNTPSAADGSADLQYVLEVVSGIARHLQQYRIIVNKSTAPIGTCQRLKKLMNTILSERGIDTAFDVVANPEFLRQGCAIQDFMCPDRIVVGTDNERAKNYMMELYAPLVSNAGEFTTKTTPRQLISMDMASAELTKYAANAFLATRISFINEMGQLAEQFGADIEHVRRGIGSDARIGQHFLFAGCGFGGSCFPKDVRALKKMAEQNGLSPSLLHAIETINEQQKNILFKKINDFFHGNLSGKVIALWGLAFKPHTDDMREAPSRTLITALLSAGATIQAYDPAAADTASAIYQHEPQFQLGKDREAVLERADVLVIVTEWPQFQQLDAALLKAKLQYRTVFDGRNLYAPEQLTAHGLNYYAVGRGFFLSDTAGKNPVTNRTEALDAY